MKFNKFKKIIKKKKLLPFYTFHHRVPSASREAGGGLGNAKTAGTSCVDKEFASSNVSRSFSSLAEGKKKKRRRDFWGFVASKTQRPFYQHFAPNVIQARR